MSLLARLSLANRTIVALAALIIIGFGVFSIPQLKQQLIPSIEFPGAFVTANYPGASPDIVESQVTTPIEDAVKGLDGVKNVTSTSGDGSASIQLEFVFGTDLDKATSDIQQAINGIKNKLPDNVDPQVVTGNSDDIPAVVFAVTSSLPEQDLAKRLDHVVVPKLSDIDGVRQAEVTGARDQQIKIELDQSKMTKHGVDTSAVSNALSANGTPVPAGSLDQGGKSISVQTGKKFASLDDIKNIYVTPGASGGGSGGGGSGSGASSGGGAPTGRGLPGTQPTTPKPVKLGDIAKISLVDAKATTITRTNGKPSLGILVTAAPDGNNVAISDAVRDKLPGLTKDMGSDTKLTIVFDQAPYVKDSIRSLSTEGVLGLVFAVIVILLFLLSMRSTLVTAVSIPMSVLIALIAMWTGDLSLNLLTLGGLTVAVGRVVDDSIVVLENIKRHLGYGEEKRQAVLNGVKEVATAVTASTLTTVAVFLPIAFISGIVGELFRPFAVTVTIALLASLLVALTLIPVLCYWFLRTPKHVDTEHLEEFQRKVAEKERRSPMQRIYVPIIRFSSRFRFVPIVLALLILVGTGLAGTRLKTNFIDSSGGNSLAMTQTMPVGTNLQTTSSAVTKVEGVLADAKDVDDYQVTIGGGLYGGPSARGAASASYQLTLSKDADTAAVQQDLRSRIADLSDVGNITVDNGSGGFGGSSQLQVTVQSSDEDALRRGADQVRSAVAGLDHVADVTSDMADNAPRIQITLKRETAAKYGLTDSSIGQAVTAAMQGNTVTQMTLSGDQDDVVLTTDDAPKNLDDIKALTIPTALGKVRVDKVATVTQGSGPFSISHVDGNRSATITATPTGNDTGAVSNQLNTKLRDLDLPSGVSYSVGGVSQDQSDAFSSLGLALVAAILIVFVIMAATFRSIAQPLILMVSVPFAATGAIGLLVATDTPLGVSALIGVLMLVGIVVTNAIVLMDLMNRYRLAGMSVQEAVVEGGRRRLRPVLMTAVATICALTPMALGLTESGNGGFVSQSLAVVVIGGLVSSTLLTLVLVPTLWTSLELGKERRRARRERRHERKAAKAMRRGKGGKGGKGAPPAARSAPPKQPPPRQEEAPAPVPVPAGAPVAPAAQPEAAGAEPARPQQDGHAPVPAWARDRVRSALEGENPTVLTRMEGGFACIGDVQFLPGYCVLLTDDPEASRLSDLPRRSRLQFLADAERLGEAVERVCSRRDPAFRRINVEIQGNMDGFLHAHIWPRYEWEPADIQQHPVGRYSDERWHEPETRLGPQHDQLRAEILAELNQLVHDPAQAAASVPGRRGPESNGSH